jgi:hypothetical protein
MGMADDDQDYQDFKQEHALRVSPKTGNWTHAYKKKKEVA